MPWPNPQDADGLEHALSAAVPQASATPGQKELSFFPQRDGDEPDPEVGASVASSEVAYDATKRVDPPTFDAADELFRTVRSLVLRVVQEPKKAAEIAKALGVTQRQAEEWLRRLVEERLVEKSKKPVRYAVRQASLLEPDGRTESTVGSKPA